MKMKLHGFMTAEASVMFPTLVFVSFTMIYLLIYIYDAILVRTDLNSLSAAIRSSERDYYYTYKEIKEEQVYISGEEVLVEMTKDNARYTITVKYKWVFPLVRNINRDITASTEVKVINPFEIMRITDDIVDTVAGVTNDSDEDN